MTTLVQTRQPLQVLSMSNTSKRTRSERNAAYDEDDDGFQFNYKRSSKRVKPSLPDPIPEDEPAPAPAPAPRRGRPPKQKAAAQAAPPPPPPPPPPQSAPKRTSKRRSSQISDPFEDPAPPPKPLPRTTRQKTRASLDKPVIAPKKAANGIPKSRKVVEERAEEQVGEEEEEAQSPEMQVDSTPRVDGVSSSKTIALPFSDTPVINRNKEMRKKTGNRRSSLGLRGRRASSLISAGHTAIPHKEVDAAEFYKHIEADGLTEPRRMKQLLTWCGERSLSEKPPLGSLNSNAILGARAIQDQLLKDFSARSEFSDWFGREDSQEEVVPRPPPIVKPNPRNSEHDEKIAELEERIKRLKAEKKKWQSLKQQPPEIPSLFDSGEPPVALSSMDPLLLDPDEAKMLASLTDSSNSSLLPKMKSRLQTIQSSLEAKLDRLADNVHKVEQRMDAGRRQADQILVKTATRLKEREEREKKSAGTKELPIMEVLRSLGRILPEGGG
ncbi:hypothetical protein F5Y18DRAFT_368757 [Xylariaceae sp. FL1019]|nr:hypothetical protein F5Y18DRAFT_368757 [Xylariaceae sp. FL1019]